MRGMKYKAHISMYKFQRRAVFAHNYTFHKGQIFMQ